MSLKNLKKELEKEKTSLKDRVELSSREPSAIERYGKAIAGRFKEHPFISTLTPFGVTGVQDFGEVAKETLPDVAVQGIPPFLPPVPPFKKAETEFRKELVGGAGDVVLSPINWVLPIVGQAAKKGLIKGGIKTLGTKATKAGHGVGKVEIPAEAIGKTAARTSIPKAAKFRVAAGKAKIPPKFKLPPGGAEVKPGVYINKALAHLSGVKDPVPIMVKDKLVGWGSGEVAKAGAPVKPDIVPTGKIERATVTGREFDPTTKKHKELQKMVVEYNFDTQKLRNVTQKVTKDLPLEEYKVMKRATIKSAKEKGLKLTFKTIEPKVKKEIVKTIPIGGVKVKPPSPAPKLDKIASEPLAKQTFQPLENVEKALHEFPPPPPTETIPRYLDAIHKEGSETATPTLINWITNQITTISRTLKAPQIYREMSDAYFYSYPVAQEGIKQFQNISQQIWGKNEIPKNLNNTVYQMLEGRIPVSPEIRPLKKMVG